MYPNTSIRSAHLSMKTFLHLNVTNEWLDIICDRILIQIMARRGNIILINKYILNIYIRIYFLIYVCICVSIHVRIYVYDTYLCINDFIYVPIYVYTLYINRPSQPRVYTIKKRLSVNVTHTNKNFK